LSAKKIEGLMTEISDLKMRSSLLRTELDAVKRINEQYELIKLLPKASAEGDNSELVLEI